MARSQVMPTVDRCCFNPRLMKTGTPTGGSTAPDFRAVSACWFVLPSAFTGALLVGDGDFRGLLGGAALVGNAGELREYSIPSAVPEAKRSVKPRRHGSRRAEPPMGVPVFINLGPHPYRLTPASTWYLAICEWRDTRSMLPERSTSPHPPGHDCEGWLPRAEQS
jgi:hypothetical protein